MGKFITGKFKVELNGKTWIIEADGFELCNNGGAIFVRNGDGKEVVAAFSRFDVIRRIEE